METHRIRARVVAALRVAVALVLVLPLTLGMAMPAYALALAGPAEHTCRCGMEAGECGCPACNRDQENRSSSPREGPSCTDCGGDSDVAGPVASAQPVVLPASPLGRLVWPERRSLTLLRTIPQPDDPPRSPPTPPPRIARS